MVAPTPGVEPIKDPMMDDWKGGLVCRWLGGWVDGGLFGRRQRLAWCSCVGCGLTWVWGSVNAKWQGLDSFAKTPALNANV